MNKNIIIAKIKDLLNSQRILETLSWYLILLILPADKHTQANAEKILGKDNTLFSNLLAGNANTSKLTLNRASRRAIKKLSRKRDLIQERQSPKKLLIKSGFRAFPIISVMEMGWVLGRLVK